MNHLIQTRTDCLPIGTPVHFYQQGVLQGRRVVVGYARNDCYILRDEQWGTTIHAYHDDVEPEPKPTWSKPCQKCGKTVERWRGEGDVSCECGANYNAFGQRLRDDWRDNPSNYDDEVSDLDGFEISQLRNEDY